MKRPVGTEAVPLWAGVSNVYSKMADIVDEERGELSARSGLNTQCAELGDARSYVILVSCRLASHLLITSVHIRSQYLMRLVTSDGVGGPSSSSSFYRAGTALAAGGHITRQILTQPETLNLVCQRWGSIDN